MTASCRASTVPVIITIPTTHLFRKDLLSPPRQFPYLPNIAPYASSCVDAREVRKVVGSTTKAECTEVFYNAAK